MTATLDRVRVGFIGAGRISDLHALEYIANPERGDRRHRRRQSRPRRAAGAGLGLPRCEDLHRLSRAPRRPERQCRRHPPPASPPLRGGARGDGRGQARLAAEGDDHHRRRRRPPGRAVEDGDGRLPGLRELHLLPAGDEGEGADRRGRDRRARCRSGSRATPAGAATAWEVPAYADAWRQDRARNGGGPLAFDDGHHKFALAWHFMGLAEEVHAWIGETRAAGRRRRRRAGDHLVEVPAATAIGHLEIVYSPDLEIVTGPLRPGRPARDHRHRGRHRHQRAAMGGWSRGRRSRSMPAASRRASASPMPSSAGRRASSIRPATGSRRSGPAPRRISPARRAATSSGSPSPPSSRPSSAGPSGSTR